LPRGRQIGRQADAGGPRLHDQLGTAITGRGRGIEAPRASPSGALRLFRLGSLRCFDSVGQLGRRNPRQLTAEPDLSQVDTHYPAGTEGFRTRLGAAVQLGPGSTPARNESNSQRRPPKETIAIATPGPAAATAPNSYLGPLARSSMAAYWSSTVRRGLVDATTVRGGGVWAAPVCVAVMFDALPATEGEGGIGGGPEDVPGTARDVAVGGVRGLGADAASGEAAL
jgi:hypothetical protein